MSGLCTRSYKALYLIKIHILIIQLTFYLRAIFGHTMYIFLSAFYFNPVQCLNNEGVYENVVKFNCSLTWEWFDESRIKS